MSTPRTEAFCAPHRGLGTGYYQALDFARQLERELSAEHELACILQSQVDNHDATLEQVKVCMQEKVAKAEAMRGEALLALGIMQNERDAAEAHIARESRISDSEMMALLRRRVKAADDLESQIRQSIASVVEADWNIAERDTLDAVNVLFRIIKGQKP